MTREQLDQLCVNTIRTLSMDAVQQANSGHPGTPMAMAPVAIAYGSDFSASIRKTRSGPIETVLSCPSATPRCCCTPCFISPG